MANVIRYMCAGLWKIGHVEQSRPQDHRQLLLTWSVLMVGSKPDTANRSAVNQPH